MKSFSIAVLTLGLVASAVTAQKRFVDETFGYSVKTMKKWVGVPVEPTQTTVAARWSSERQDAHGGGAMVVRYFRRDPQGGTKPTPDVSTLKEGEDMRALLERLMARQAPTSYSAWVGGRTTLGEPTRFSAKAPKGVELTANLYEVRSEGSYMVVGVYATPHLELAVELRCHGEGERKYRNAFKSVAKSLILLRAPATKAVVNERAARNRPSTARERALKKARADANRVKGWWYLESENYFIVTNYPKRKKGRILDLQRRLEAIRKHFLTDLPPVRPIDEISIVRVCKDRKSYLQYGAPPASAGYWYALAEELVIYMEGEKNFTRAVLSHEAFHQYIHYAARARPHTWYNEGNADYYGGCEVKGSKLVSDSNRMRLDTIRGHIRAGTHVPLKKLLRLSHAGYMADATRCYAQGWSLLYFLREGVPEGHPWSTIVGKYYRVLCETKKASAALQAAFAQVDFEKFEAAWARFITRGDPVRS